MALVNKGVNIFFGNGSTTTTALATSLIQSMDIDKKAEEVKVRNQSGVTVGVVYYDPIFEATFEYIVADGSTGAGNASFTSPVVGDSVTVASASHDTSLNGVWIVSDVVFKYMNNDCLKVSLKCTKFPAITS